MWRRATLDYVLFKKIDMYNLGNTNLYLIQTIYDLETMEKELQKE